MKELKVKRVIDSWTLSINENISISIVSKEDLCIVRK